MFNRPIRNYFSNANSAETRNSKTINKAPAAVANCARCVKLQVANITNAVD